MDRGRDTLSASAGACRVWRWRFMMNSQEMETAVRLGLNLVVLVLQDNAYGMIRWKQQADGFADFGMTFGNPDFGRTQSSGGSCEAPMRQSIPVK
jgi:hypothetical protein